MAGRDDLSRDLGSLVVSAAESLAETGDPWEPYRLTGPDGARVEAVSEFLRDLQAAGRPATTQRSYGLALLRWFRFTWAVDVPWDQATRTEALIRENSLYLSWLAEDYILLNEIDLAAEIATRVPELGSRADSARTDERLRHLARLLRRFEDVQSVATFLDGCKGQSLRS